MWILHAGNDNGNQGTLRSESSPTDKEIKEALSGNLCRCTGYVNIIRAVASGVPTHGKSRRRQMTFQIVGKSKPRYGGLGHVTGETRYVDDMFIPGMLIIKALRSPVHKGVIQNLETSRADKLPGFTALSPRPTFPATHMVI